MKSAPLQPAPVPYGVRAALFVAATLAITLGTALHVHRRVSRGYELSPRGRRLLAILLLGGPVLLGASRRAEAWVGSGVAGAAGTIGSVLVLATLASSAAFAVMAAIAWLRSRVRRRAERTSSAPATEPVALGRREMMRRATLAIPASAALGVGAYGAIFGRHEYSVEDVAVPIEGLPRALDGYRIAQLSDLHFGIFCGAPERRAALDLVRRARPDLVVVTGDLVDNHVRHMDEVGRLLRALTALRPRDGVVVIGGNHDYYAGMEDVLAAAQGAGARVLRNQAITIAEGEVALLGLDDLWGRMHGWGPGPDLDAALTYVRAELPRIVLSHNPSTFDETAGRVALQLSGHTHGGQLAVAGLPASALFTYVRGLYRARGSTLYVNRGFGVAGPAMRLGAPPEVTIVHLDA